MQIIIILLALLYAITANPTTCSDIINQEHCEFIMSQNGGSMCQWVYQSNICQLNSISMTYCADQTNEYNCFWASTQFCIWKGTKTSYDNDPYEVTKQKQINNTNGKCQYPKCSDYQSESDCRSFDSTTCDWQDDSCKTVNKCSDIATVHGCRNTRFKFRCVALQDGVVMSINQKSPDWFTTFDCVQLKCIYAEYCQPFINGNQCFQDSQLKCTQCSEFTTYDDCINTNNCYWNQQQCKSIECQMLTSPNLCTLDQCKWIDNDIKCSLNPNLENDFCYAGYGYAELYTTAFLSRYAHFSIDLKSINRTTHLVYKKLGELNSEFQQLQSEAMKGAIDEHKRKRMNQLDPKIHLYNNLSASLSVIKDANQLLEIGGSAEEIQYLTEEIQEQQQLLKDYSEEALEQLIEKDEYDDIRQVTMEIRPGVGGSEGSLFAEDLLNMYTAYANVRNWDCRVLTQSKDNQIGKGCKLGILQIIGDEAYSRLKCESGVHKVIRVPETESKGRLHSSTAVVIVLPKVEDNFVLLEKDLKFDFMKASGPGGQHVNKTESACRVTHIPTGIAVANMEDRSQDRNKTRAIQILREKLFAIHIQEKQDRLLQRRKSQVQGSDRSDKIRTYNFPQERITDHRTNVTLYGMEKMLQGQLLEDLIDKYLEKIYNNKLEDLIDELEEQ